MDVTLLLFLLSVIGIRVSKCCPENEDMVPCECRRLLKQLIVVCCKKILIPEELIPPMHSLAVKGTEVGSLTISNSSLLYLPENLFQNAHIRTVRIENSEFASFSESDTAFKGLENTLIALYFEKIKSTSHWDFSHLRKLQKLEAIYLDHVILPSIDHPFPNFPYLIRLEFNHAEISYITDNAFSNLPKLKYFDMQYNEIKEMKRTMLPNPANNLLKMYLSHNKLGYLSRDFFDNMPSLSHVSLDDNKFTTLAEKPFSVAFKNLPSLSMLRNPIRCDCRMSWIVYNRHPKFFRGVCSAPAALFGRHILTLDLKSLWC